MGLGDTAQGEYTILHITVTNIGSEAQTLDDGSQYVYDASGRKFSASSSADLDLAGANGQNNIWLEDISLRPGTGGKPGADALPGSTIPERTEAQVQLQDGSWIWCEVIGQRKDRHGRWCVGIRWYASPSVGGREGWYVLDGSRIRRFSALTSGRPRPCRTCPRPAPPGHRG